ncbi:MAG: hypothetical protein ACRKGH_09755, partial [Dehalogenimonas sp.]
MKKTTFILFILLVAAAPRIFAQNAPISTIGNIASTGTSVILPITVINFNDIGSAYLTLHYDPTIMTATEVATGPPLFGTGLNYNISTPGLIIISWYTSPGISIPDNSVAFNLHFTKVSGGVSPVTWDDTDDYSNIYFDGLSDFLNDSPFSDFYFPGSVTFQDYAPTTVAPDIAACPGTTISVPVIVNNFNNIGAISLRLDYNTSALTYVSAVNNAGYPLNINGTSTPGSVYIGGFSSNPNGVTYPFNTTLVTLNFTYLGGSTGLNWIDIGTSCEYGGPTGEPILNDSPQSTYYINGQVSGYPVPTLVSATATDAPCYGGNGNITIAYTGGTGTLNYTIGSETNQTGIFSRVAGIWNYSVSDASGCPPVTGTVTVGEPADVIASASVTTPIACFGGSATVTLVASGGTGAYSYTFNGITQSNGVFTNIPAGTAYAWSIKDANLCEKTGTLNVTQPTDISASASVTTAIACYGGAATVTLSANGGTGSYSFTFNGVTQNNGAFTNIPAGTNYAWSVKDANNCEKSGTLDVTQPTDISASASITTPIACFGGTATLALSASGGTGAYSYTFNGVTQSTGVFNNITAGSAYAWSIKDGNNCEKSGTLDVTQPADISASASVTTAIACFGGTATVTLTASGGTGAYSYTFNGITQSTGVFTNIPAGTNYAWSVKDANNCEKSGTLDVTQPAVLTAEVTSQVNVSCNGGSNGSVVITAAGGIGPYIITPTQTGLSAGDYTFTVTDNNLCTTLVTATITQPSVLTAFAVVSYSTCGNSNGSVDLSVSGGTPAYTYAWSNGATTQDLVNVPANTYSVTITDASGCTATASATVNNIDGPTASISAQTNVACNGALTGSATVLATGGTSPFTYLWDDPAAQTTATANNLAAGTYNVTVTDENGCTATDQVTITQPAAALTASINVQTNVSCFGNATGSATVTATGGTPDYTYLWDDLAAQTTATANNLAAGTYNVTVTDENGCTATDQVTITQPAAALTASINVQTN